MTTGFFGLFETKIDTEGTFSKRHGSGNRYRLGKPQETQPWNVARADRLSLTCAYEATAR